MIRNRSADQSRRILAIPDIRGAKLLSPRSALAGLVVLHVTIWTLLPTMLTSNAMLDPIEGLAWGHEWQLGYHKGPPLWSWLMEATAMAFGQRLWPMYLESQICIAATFLAIWLLGRRVAGEREALLAVLLLEGVYYFAYPTPEFNEIILLMPFGALLGWVLHRALCEDRLADWVLAGLLAGAGLWVRYAMGAYVIALGLFVLLHPVARRSLAKPGPYVAVAVSMIVFAPHAAWIVDSNLISLRYVGERAGSPMTAAATGLSVLRFAAAQLLALLPMILLVMVLRHLRPRAPWSVTPFDRAYLATAALGPCAAAMAIALVSGHGLRSMWGGPLWCFVGLFAVAQLRLHLPDLRRDRLFGASWLLTFMLPALSFVAVHSAGAAITGRDKKAHFPGAVLARDITTEWHRLFDRPLRHVAGSTWLAGNVAFYSPDRPSVFIGADRTISPWIDPHELACAGAVLVWSLDRDGDDPPSRLRAAFPTAERQEAIILHGRQQEYRIGWAIERPVFESCR